MSSFIKVDSILLVFTLKIMSLLTSRGLKLFVLDLLRHLVGGK